MYENDDLGFAADVLAGPFAGAFLHSREHYDTMENITNWAGPVAGVAEAAHLAKAGSGTPWGSIVEAGMSGANALNQGMHGDWGGAAGTFGKGLAHANGGLPGMLAHWIE